MLDVILEQPHGASASSCSRSHNTDERLRADKPVSPAFLFAALLWHEVLTAWKALRGDGHEADARAARSDGPGRAVAVGEARDSAALHGADMKELWALQPRFEHRAAAGGRGGCSSIQRFRAGYDFLLLRCESGEVRP